MLPSASIEEKTYFVEFTLVAATRGDIDWSDFESAGVVGITSCWWSSLGSNGGRYSLWHWIGHGESRKDKSSECSTHLV